MKERLRRLGHALEEMGCDAYLSADPADVGYFTGSEDTDGVVLVEPERPTRLLTRFSALCHVQATATNLEVTPIRIGESAEKRLVEMLKSAGARVVAVAALGPAAEAALAAALPAVRLDAAPLLSARLRRHKEAAEIELLRRAADIVDQAMTAAMASIRGGVSELEIAAVFESTARRLGATGAIGATQVKSGRRAAFADAPASDAPIEANAIGFVDVAIRYHHYLGDMTRAFVVGEPPAEQMRILEAVDQIQRMARGMVRVGAACRLIDAEVRRTCAEAGYPECPPHHTGHAMGLGGDIPRLVPHSDEMLEEGDVITIEPGIYVPGLAGVRIEDVLIVENDGHERLSQAPRVTAIG